MTISSSSAITYEKIYSQSHANIYNLINSRSNIPDPADSSGNRKFVYVREPKNLARGFNGFPFVVIPSFSVSQKNNSADMTRAMVTYDIIVKVITQDKDSDSLGDPNGAEQLNQISDNILKVINANRKTLINQGMAHFELSDSNLDYDDLDGKMTYVREFVLTFKNRLKVTA